MNVTLTMRVLNYKDVAVVVLDDYSGGILPEVDQHTVWIAGISDDHWISAAISFYKKQRKSVERKLSLHNERYKDYKFKVWEGCLEGSVLTYEELTGAATVAAEGLRVGESRIFRSAYEGQDPAMIINLGRRDDEYVPPLPVIPMEPVFV